MLGVSISPKFLLEQPSNNSEQILFNYFGGPEKFLLTLKNRGISYIELRSIYADADPLNVQKVIEIIWNTGLKISIHGILHTKNQGKTFLEIYPSLQNVLADIKCYQSSIMITVHSHSGQQGSLEDYSDQTVETLSRWCEMIKTENLPVCFALELNRKKGYIDPSSSCRGAVDMVDRIGSPYTGICWDFGHYYYNMANYTENHLQLPPQSFMEKVIHTHIHGVGAKGTHDSLVSSQCLPLENYIKLLKETGYKGVYNMEFSFDKFTGDSELHDALFTSIERTNDSLNNINV